MTFNDDIEAELAHVQPKTQAMSESWGASAILDQVLLDIYRR